MGAKGRLIVPFETIVEALPWGGISNGHQVWMHRRKLKLTAPVPREIARAHCEIAQTMCCVVRQKPDGPRGGRGPLHYNGEQSYGNWWPTSWDHAHKGYRFYIVAEVVSHSHNEKVRANTLAGMVAGATEVSNAGVQIMHTETVSREELIERYRKAHPDIVEVWGEESRTFNEQQWEALSRITNRGQP